MNTLNPNHTIINKDFEVSNTLYNSNTSKSSFNLMDNNIKIKDASELIEIIKAKYYKKISNVKNIFDSNENDKTTKNFFIVGISGIPGSGKSTISEEIKQHLNSSNINTTILPLDGYHIPRKNLNQELLLVRGSVQTFDLEQYVKDIKEFIIKGEFKFPSFSHGIKDPINEDIIINKEVDVIIIEGLYVFDNSICFENKNNYLSETSYKSIFDIKVFVDIEITKTYNIVANRNFKAGIYSNYNEAYERAVNNDGKNGEYVLKNSDFTNCYVVHYNNI